MALSTPFIIARQPAQAARSGGGVALPLGVCALLIGALSLGLWYALYRAAASLF